MKQILLFALILGLFAPVETHSSVFEVQPWETITTTNNGVITEPPVIDATTFVNYGTITIDTIWGGASDPSSVRNV